MVSHQLKDHKAQLSSTNDDFNKIPHLVTLISRFTCWMALRLEVEKLYQPVAIDINPRG